MFARARQRVNSQAARNNRLSLVAKKALAQTRRPSQGFKPVCETLEDRVFMAAQQLLVNPSFSSGCTVANVSGDFYAGTNLSNYHSGPGYAAGGVDTSGNPKNNASGSISQPFTVPANATSTNISWYRYITTNETSTSVGYDHLYVQLLNSSGSVIGNLRTYSNLDKGTGYVQDSVNIGSYAGQSLRIQFMENSDSSLTTTFRLDDINVVATTPDSTGVPNSPAGLSASVASSSQISLSWIDNSATETGSSIERKTGANGTWGQIATVGANATSFPDTGLSAGTTFYYRVRAFNSSGTSAYSNEANATTQPTSSAVTWGTAVGSFNGVVNYSNSPTGRPTTEPYNTSTGKNTGLEWECVEYVNRYYLQVYGQDLRGRAQINASSFYGSAASLQLAPNPSNGTSAPQVGDILCFGGGSGGLGHVAIVCAVSANSVTVIQQNVRQTSDDSSYTFPMSISGGKYFVDGTRLGSTYACQGWLRYVAPVASNSAPAAPTNLRFTRTGAGQGTLAWNNNSNNESGFELQWLNGSTWSTAYTSTPNVTGVNVSFSPGSTYQMRIVAFNAYGSSISNVITVSA